MSDPAVSDPQISVIVLNYNGARWLDRCVESLCTQTIAARCEFIIADNRSTDGSEVLAAKLVRSLPNGRFHDNGGNVGFCEGNNIPARIARGEFLFFLNNDTWLEPDCLERLLAGAEKAGASAAMPLVLNYPDNTFQHQGVSGFDWLGVPTHHFESDEPVELFSPHGCAYLIRRDVFHAIGQFDRELFMYADEMDLSLRVWISGHSAVLVKDARLHHRGAANVNPKGENSMIELRTSDSKRYYTNRNNLYVWLKTAQHILFLMLPLYLLLLAVEALAGLVITRRWSFVRNSYWRAIVDCARMRKHWLQERRRIRLLRKRSDWWMLRFLQWRPQRIDEILRAWRFGLPKVTPN